MLGLYWPLLCFMPSAQLGSKCGLYVLLKSRSRACAEVPVGLRCLLCLSLSVPVPWLWTGTQPCSRAHAPSGVILVFPLIAMFRSIYIWLAVLAGSSVFIALQCVNSRFVPPEAHWACLLQYSINFEVTGMGNFTLLHSNFNCESIPSNTDMRAWPRRHVFLK